MKVKSFIYKFSFLGVCAVLGITLAVAVHSFSTGDRGEALLQGRKPSRTTDDRIPVKNLEEFMWFVDAIVVGTVEEIHDTFQKNSGIPTKRAFSFPVTPATVRVDQIVSGDVQQKTITLLQHGTREEVLKQNVEPGTKYVLMLQDTSTPGEYWTLGGREGIWEIANGRVHHKAPTHYPSVDQWNGKKLDPFLKALSKASANKNKTGSPSSRLTLAKHRISARIQKTGSRAASGYFIRCRASAETAHRALVAHDFSLAKPNRGNAARGSIWMDERAGSFWNGSGLVILFHGMEI